MTTENDPVNHPSHYTAYNGFEVIQLTEQMNFNRGNAVKYIARAGKKQSADEVEDLKKAQWYIAREIQKIEGERTKAQAFKEAVITGWTSELDEHGTIITKKRENPNGNFGV